MDLSLLRELVGWRDLLDVAIVALIIYYVLHLIRGTRAVQMVVGMLLAVAALLRRAHLAPGDAGNDPSKLLHLPTFCGSSCSSRTKSDEPLPDSVAMRSGAARVPKTWRRFSTKSCSPPLPWLRGEPEP